MIVEMRKDGKDVSWRREEMEEEEVVTGHRDECEV